MGHYILYNKNQIRDKFLSGSYFFNKKGKEGDEIDYNVVHMGV